MENPWKPLINGGVHEKIWYKMLHMVITCDHCGFSNSTFDYQPLPATRFHSNSFMNCRSQAPDSLRPRPEFAKTLVFRSWYCCINIAGKPRFSGTAAGKPQFSLKCTKLSVFVLDWFLMALLAANWAADPPVSSLRHRIWMQWMETVTHVWLHPPDNRKKVYLINFDLPSNMRVPSKSQQQNR